MNDDKDGNSNDRITEYEYNPQASRMNISYSSGGWFSGLDTIVHLVRPNEQHNIY